MHSALYGASVAVPLFDFAGVSVRFGDRVALDRVTLQLPDQGVTILAGPSGSGKSTLLRLCNRLEVATGGEVRFRGQPIEDLDPLQLRRRVGMVFQRPTLFPGTVRDNLLVAARPGDEGTFAEALDQAGLDPSFLDRTGDDLSGGEAQRVCLARTLVTRPEVLLADEPTASLDPAATRILEHTITGLARGGTAVVWVSHDRSQARRIGDHRFVLVDGRLAAPEQADRYFDEPG